MRRLLTSPNRSKPSMAGNRTTSNLLTRAPATECSRGGFSPPVATTAHLSFALRSTARWAWPLELIGWQLRVAARRLRGMRSRRRVPARDPTALDFQSQNNVFGFIISLVNKRRRIWLVIGAVTLTAAGWFAPGPIEGCYEATGVSSDGTYFIRFHNGGLYYYDETHNDVSGHPPLYLTSYYRDPKNGWILSGNQERIQPHLLFLRIVSPRGATYYRRLFYNSASQSLISTNDA
jgi:hypothetical protein